MPHLAAGFFLLINLIAVFITIHDKRAAINGRRRIPEATLLWIAACGGATAMYVTMKRIRHKTQKPKFMIGLPLLLFLHVTLIVTVWLWQNGLLIVK